MANGGRKYGPSKLKDWQEALGIDWVRNRRMLAEAIPPAYSEYIGTAFLQKVNSIATISEVKP
jgi:hypothetical protein